MQAVGVRAQTGMHNGSPHVMASGLGYRAYTGDLKAGRPGIIGPRAGIHGGRKRGTQLRRYWTSALSCNSNG